MERKDGTLADRREMLRVKLKSLATEAKYIRSEEDRRPHTSLIRLELREHRIKPLRIESRATGLAYGFIKGYERSRIENKRHPMPEWVDKDLLKKVEAMVKRYGPPGFQDTAALAQWWSGSP